MSKNPPSTPLPSQSFEKLIAVEQPEPLDQQPPPSQRRRFLGGLAASTVAVISGCSRDKWSGELFSQWIRDLEEAGGKFMSVAQSEYDSWFAENKNSKEPFPSPAERRKTAPQLHRRPVILADEKDYAEFLGNLNLTYIKPHEVLRPHRNVRSGVANELPPKNLWSRMAPTLQVADAIRSRLGSRLSYINSAYRSPAYNAKCPGAASRSYHMQNCALDLMFDAGSDAAFAVAKKLRSEGVFKGGIGLYDSFIHIDTRGYASTWGEV